MTDLICLYVGRIFILGVTSLGLMAFVYFCVNTVYRKGKHAKHFIEYLAHRKIKKKL